MKSKTFHQQISRTVLIAAIAASSLFFQDAAAQIVSERSVQLGNTPINVVFTNQMAGNVNAFWVDFNGINQPVGLLLPNQSVQLTTYPGHITIFTSQNQTVAKYKGDALGNKAFSIVGPTGRPVNSSPIQSVQIPVQNRSTSNNTTTNNGRNTVSNISNLLQGLSNTFGRNRRGTNTANNNASNNSTLSNILSNLANSNSGQNANTFNTGNQNSTGTGTGATNFNANPGGAFPATVTTTTANFRSDPTLNLPINPANPDVVSIAIAIAHVTNEYRIQNGKSELTISTPLSNAAKMHADYTRDIQTVTHTNTSDPTKRTPTDRAALFGVTGVGISENAIQNFGVQYIGNTSIFVGQKLPNHTAITLADALVTGPDGWKFSPGHNSNMLNDAAKAIGCGIAFDTNAATAQVPKTWGIQKFSL